MTPSTTPSTAAISAASTTASTTCTSDGTATRAVSPVVAAGLLAGVGFGVGMMVVAARGGAASESAAPFVMALTMPVVMLAATFAAVAGQRWETTLGRRFAWGLGGTLGLFGVALGWLGSARAALPSWPLSLLAALAVAAPALVAAFGMARTARADAR